MTDWRWLVFLVCSDPLVGNALAVKVAAFPDDPNAEAETFVDSRRTADGRFWAAVPARAGFAVVAESLAAGLDYSDSDLGGMGGMVSESDWLAALAVFEVVVIELFARDGSRRAGVGVDDLAAALGVEIVPEPPAADLV